ncbi:TPA: hypothetical protein ACH3X2_011425 [Trebouxia sp. C0005]|nr:MAG: hypothetical protein FRX49_07234 [Trebouxia sp. A1-2]
MSSSGQDLASAPADASAPSSTVATLAAQLANTVSVSDTPSGSADAAGTSASAGADTLPLYTPISGSALVKYTTAFQSKIVDSLHPQQRPSPLPNQWDLVPAGSDLSLPLQAGVVAERNGFLASKSCLKA